MTTEHLRPLLDDVSCMQLFTALGSRLARALVPQVAVDLIRVETVLDVDGGGSALPFVTIGISVGGRRRDNPQDSAGRGR